MKAMTNNTIWLTDESQISKADNDSLKRSLLTCDGKGSIFKQKVLDELLERSFWRGKTGLDKEY
jgi:hypothetical protein